MPVTVYLDERRALLVGLFTRAIEANPREARVYLGRGMARLELNEAEKAKADFERVSTTANKLHLKQQADDFLRKIPPL